MSEKYTPKPEANEGSVEYHIIPEADRIHPDFGMGFLRFSQNRIWDASEHGKAPDVKASIVFDDPDLLNDDPFITKISPDLKGEYAYFGIAYGRTEYTESLKEWAAGFPSAKLFSYNGEYIETISGTDQVS